MQITQPATDTERRKALRLLLMRPDLSTAELDRQIDLLERYCQQRDLSLANCLVAEGDDDLATVCLCIDSPGRAASVFLPSNLSDTTTTNALTRLLAETADRARQRNVQFLQSLIPPQAVDEENIYRQAGFKSLAELIYMEADLTRPSPPAHIADALTWIAYSGDAHALFARVVEDTYEDSLDCGSLNGLRNIEDILATHRATGEFDPAAWLVPHCDGEPVGAVLLAATPEQSAWEVVYMGLLPTWRGRGYGSALLRRAMALARERAALRLTLAVDQRNAPARRLYGRFGFVETSRRHAWIHILENAHPPRDPRCDAAP